MLFAALSFPVFGQKSAILPNHFIYLGKDAETLHLVWEEHPVFKVERYVIEKSYDGNSFFPVDSIRPVHLFDIHVNDYPATVNYYGHILYSTETGTGRFIYNDVRNASEAGQKNFWYRVKMLKANGEKLYTKTVVESFSLPGENRNEAGSRRGGGVGLGGGSPGGPRGGGCPDVQQAPAGYSFTGNTQTFYGDCCYWEEHEYQASQFTQACGGLQAWCCPRDCSPLAYDPCCVHICSEYNQCSCHPWTCCDVSNASIWVVVASTTYTINASITGIQDPFCNGSYDGLVNVNNTGGVQPVTYSWSNGTITGGILNQLAAGVYSLTISDANNCSETLSFTLTNPPPLTSSLSVGDVSCFGFNDGFIDAAVNGGTPPYTYTWTGGSSSGATSQDLTGIGPGNYALTVTDANNCVSNQFAPVFSPDEFSGVITFLDLGCLNSGSAVLALCCYGSNTGSAVLSLSGGTPPNSFLWADGDTAAIKTDLPAGTYAVTAVDANGCSFATSATLGERPEIILSFAATKALCGQCDGTANIIVNGGSGLFNFIWPASAGGQTTANVTGLCAGSYNVTVSDAFAANCSKTINVSISNDGGETISVSHTDVSCADLCNGSASVNFNCSSPVCTVAWNDPQGALLSTGSAVNNLCQGSYSVAVTNGAGCITAETVEVLNGPEITAALSLTHETCPNACNGSAAATLTGGVAPFTYEWRDSTGTPIPLQTTFSISNLCPGDYSLRAQDAAGCSVLQAFTIQPNIMAIAATGTALSCNGVCDGSITANVSGGAGPFSYQWLDANASAIAGETNQTIFNLCAGTYYARATTTSNCVLTSPAVIVSEPPAITGVVSTTDIQCFGECTGTASVVAGGGAGSYTYRWFNAANILLPDETASNIDSLCAGTYFVEVMDSNGCPGLHQADISVLVTITTDISEEDISCHNASDGVINLDVTGGGAPLSFSWNNGAYTSQNLSNLSEGTYTVVVTDANGCSATDSAVIENPGPLTAFASAYIYPNAHHVSCHDGENGRASVTVNGGTPPFTYLWSDGQQAPIAIGLPLGAYTVTVTDAENCSVTADVTLSLNPPPLLTTLVADTFTGGWNVSCFGASDGFIDLTVTNGTPPFVYEWLPVHVVFVEDLDSASAQTYIVYVTDTVNGCSTTDTITLTEPPALVTAFQPVDVSCKGGNDGAVALTVNGGTPGYDFSWNNGAFTSQNITGLTAGVYSVSVTDTNGCVITDSVAVAEPSIIPSGNVFIGTCRDSFFAGGAYQTASGIYYDTVQYGAGCDSVVITDLQFVTSFLVPDSAAVCEGRSYFVGGGQQTQAGIYYDTLVASGNCDSVIQTTLTLLPNTFTAIDTLICENEFYFAGGTNQNTSGTYYDTLAAFNGCDSIVETRLNVVNVTISATPDSAMVQEGGSVNIVINGAAGNLAYTWSPMQGLTCNSDCGNVTIVPSGDISYTVIAVDNHGCADTSTVYIEVGDTLDPNSEFAVFYVPNAFTPNGDGNNDEFRVSVSNYTSFRLLVFDRWGEKLFETDNPATGWDGTYRGKPLNPGVYVYYVDVSFSSAETPPDYLKYKKGSVTLLR